MGFGVLSGWLEERIKPVMMSISEYLEEPSGHCLVFASRFLTSLYGKPPPTDRRQKIEVQMVKTENFTKQSSSKAGLFYL